MNILYLTNTRFPSERAHSTQIVQMCQAFSDLGHCVTLVANNRSENGIETSDAFFGFKLSFKIKIIPFGIFFLAHSRVFFVLNNLYFAVHALISIKFKKYDVIYIRDEWLGFFLSFFVDTKKMVYESHEAKYNYVARHILSKGMKCVCISEGIYSEYMHKGVPSEQMIVAHDGIDASFFDVGITKEEARGRLNLSSEKKIAMYIGGFDTWKGTTIFFESSKITKEVQFVAIGGTEAQVKTCKEQYPDVLFLGYLPYKDLKYNQHAADVLVIPNTDKNDLSSRYTSPLKLFAHMTSGVPMVTSDIPSLRAVLSDSMTNWFTPSSCESLSSVILQTLDNPVLSKKRAENAGHTSLVYTWKNRSQHIISFVTEQNSATK